MACAILALAVLAVPVLGADGQISTVAGGGASTPGDNGPATASALVQPRGLALGSSGSWLFVEFGGQRLRQVDSGGTITTVAGGGLNGPTDTLVLDSGPYAGVLVADEFNHRVRRIDGSGIVTTVAGTGVSGSSGDGGPATAAQLRMPRALAPAPGGGFFVVDEYSNKVREVDASGTISTVAGTGAQGSSGNGVKATTADLFRPLGVEAIGGGDFLIADGYNNCVRKVTDGIITTVAGTCGAPDGSFSGDGGQATAALLNRPRDVVATGDGGFYIADSQNNRIRRVAPDGVITTVAGAGGAGFSGDGGAALSAKLDAPAGLGLLANGDLRVADTENNRLRLVEHPLPGLSTLSPISVQAGGAALVLTVTGVSFPSTAVVLWDGEPLATARDSSTKLRATVPAASLLSAGTVPVSVRASVNGGDTTTLQSFTITTPPPVPLPDATAPATLPPATSPTPAPTPSESPATPGSAPIVSAAPAARTAVSVKKATARGAPPKITLIAPARVRSGKTLRVLVRTSRVVPGGRVVLQRRSGRRYITIAVGSLSGRTATFRVRLRLAPQRLTLRGVVLAASRSSSVGRAATLTILPAPKRAASTFARGGQGRTAAGA